MRDIGPGSFSSYFSEGWVLEKTVVLRLNSLKTRRISPARKSCSDPGFALLFLQSRNHARSTFLTVFSLLNLRRRIKNEEQYPLFPFWGKASVTSKHLSGASRFEGEALMSEVLKALSLQKQLRGEAPRAFRFYHRFDL